MRFARLGATDLYISRYILGTMARADPTPHARRSVLRTAFEQDVTTIDAAPLYEFGDAERWVGQVLATEDRSKRVICTKVGLRWTADHGDILFSAPDADGRERHVRIDSRPTSVRREIDESLERLQIDRIDLLQVHFPDRHTPIAQTMSALSEAVRANVVRAIGVCNFSLEQAQAARSSLATQGDNLPLASVQVPYSLLDRRIEADLLPWARANDVAVLAYSPLAEGVLAGKTSAAPAEVQQAVETTLLPLARTLHLSPASVALAWALAQPGITAVIAGASRPDHVESHVRAVDATLSTDTLQTLTDAFARVAPSGGRLRRLGQRARDRAKAGARALLSRFRRT